MAKSRTQVAVEQVSATTQEAPDEIWPIAMLRIAMELKRPNSPSLEQIIDGVVRRMGIPKAEFEKYLIENVGQLEEVARRKGYVP
jgi:hypothetical protein